MKLSREEFNKLCLKTTEEYESKLKLYEKRNELLKISSRIEDEKLKERLENLI